MSATATPIPLKLAGSLFPVNDAGKSVHERTLRRWAAEGVKVGSGEVVKLRTFKVGRRRATNADLAREFIEKQNKTLEAAPTGPAAASAGDSLPDGSRGSCDSH